jgi:hypothetical protein
MFKRKVILAFCLHFPCSLSSVLGAVTVTMTGTIETGTLNEISIDGERFTVNAEIANGIDLEPRDDLGHFEISQATMQIGTSNVFHFDPLTTFYAQQIRSDRTNFGTGFVTPIGQPTEVFGYAEMDVITFSFNPNIIQPISYSSFDRAVLAGTENGGAIFTNGDNSLVIRNLSLSEASVTAIPEPNLVALLGLASVGIFAMQRRRHSSV